MHPWKEVLRTNNATYISKTLQKAIMNRSYMEKFYCKKWTNHSLKDYKKQKKTISVAFIEKKQLFSSLNPPLYKGLVKDNKLFWKTVKPFFSNKGNLWPQTKLVEENEL